MSRAKDYYADWDITPLKHSKGVCPYIGTNYCSYLCDSWLTMDDHCTLDCEFCHKLNCCPCSCKNLPRPIKFRKDYYLLFPPQWRIKKIKRVFNSLYGYYPDYIRYITEFHIRIAGPIVGTYAEIFVDIRP